MKPKSALALFLAIPVVMIGLMDLGSYSPKPIGRPDTLRIFIPYGPDTVRMICETAYKDVFDMIKRGGLYLLDGNCTSPYTFPNNCAIIPPGAKDYPILTTTFGDRPSTMPQEMGLRVHVGHYILALIDTIRAHGKYSGFPGWTTVFFSPQHAREIRSENYFRKVNERVSLRWQRLNAH